VKCLGCKSNFTLNNGQCYCQGIISLSSSTCTLCTSGTVWNTVQNICVSCDTQTPNCTACNKKTGVCSSCAKTYLLDPKAKTCNCKGGQTDVGGVCKTLKACPNGTYNNVSDVCTTCGANCAICDVRTGNCTSCGSGFTLSKVDLKSCTASCLFPVGPVEALTPTKCFTAPYSTTRVVPSYNAS
jgi:hypothetical protein